MLDCLGALESHHGPREWGRKPRGRLSVTCREPAVAGHDHGARAVSRGGRWPLQATSGHGKRSPGCLPRESRHLGAGPVRSGSES